ncbi:putative uncharacterized protein DDB_G0282133 [Teleopsis dalmanni]|uniref:putative uncharacterized protein DDB_G0282133 n=1 Tax=Teleopsis dalmanni TaxID=139649 RepID=UPI0018CFD366|nr:putative uncharacterized protein DDB_G0282133 [Teleopsis dalmanni]
MDAKISEFIPESKIENSKKETVPEHISDMNKIVSANQAETEPKDVEPTSNNCIEIPNQINELGLMDDFTSNNRIDTPTRKEVIEELDLMEELIFNNHIEGSNGMDAIEDLDQIDEDTSNNHREKADKNDLIEDLNLVEQHILGDHIETRDKKNTFKDLDRMDELTSNEHIEIPKRNNALKEFDRMENNEFSDNCDESIKIKNDHKLMNAEVCLDIGNKVNTEVKPLNVPTEDNLEQSHDKNGLMADFNLRVPTEDNVEQSHDKNRLMDDTDVSLRDNCDDDNSKNSNERDHIVNAIETVNIDMDMDSNEIYLSSIRSDDTKKFNGSAEEDVKITHLNNNSKINDNDNGDGDQNDFEVLQRSNDNSSNNDSSHEGQSETVQRSSDDSSSNDSSDEDYFEILQHSSDDNSNNNNSDEDNLEMLEHNSDDSNNNVSSDEDHSKVLQPQFNDCNIHASSDEDDIEIAHPNNKNRITDSSDGDDIKTAQSNNANNVIDNTGEDNIQIPKLCSDIRNINDSSDKVNICIPQTCDKNVVKVIIKRLKPPTKEKIVNIDQRSDADCGKRILADVSNTFPKPDESLAIEEHFIEPQPEELKLKSITDNISSQREMDLRRYSKSITAAQPQLDDKIEVDFRRKQLEDPLTMIKLNEFKRNSRHLSRKRLIKLLKNDIKYERKSRKNKQHRKGKKGNDHQNAECNYLEFLFSLNKIDGCWKKGIDKLFLDLNKRLSLQENCLFHNTLRKYQSIFETIGNTMIEELKTTIYKDLLKTSYIMQRKLCANKRKRSNNSLESELPTKKKVLKEH